MSPRTRTAALTTTLVLSLSALAACGSDGDTSAQDPQGGTTSAAATDAPEESPVPTETPTETPAETPTDAATQAPGLPACAEVWVAGATVPGSYEGCLDGEATVPADGRYCEFGKPLFTYGRDLWAVAGGPVNVTERQLLRDPGYRQALKQCGG